MRKPNLTAFDEWVARTIAELWDHIENPPPLPDKIVGVYILSDKGLCLYVGQSRDVASRVQQHRGKGIIKFTKVEILECKEHQLIEWENRYLHELTPAMNYLRPVVQEYELLDNLSGDYQ